MMAKYFHFSLFFALVFFSSCLKRPLAPPIGNTNLSYPGALVAFNSTSFLLLNTDANGDYSDGSIQLYSVGANGQYFIQNTISVSPHGSELAVSGDSRLVALSFDTSQNPTQLQFYSYLNPSSPVLLSNLTLSFNGAGGKQSIKNLHFFTPTAGNVGNFYYLYGSILNFQSDNGANGNFPTRTFVAKIAKDFSSSQIMFSLSYAVGDPNSLAPKSNSLNQNINSVQYMFGFSAPTFDAQRNLLIAFPTGSMGGFNSNGRNTFPQLPDAFTYFSGQPNGNTITGCGSSSCIQPDFRAVSLAAVDFTAILNGEPLNNSTYFVPMGWNSNGIPYASRTNGISLLYPALSGNSDSNSFSFQSGFWSSYWSNTKNIGNANSSCFPSSVTTTSGNQYSLVGDNAILVAKNGTNGGGDGGYGNEVFQVTGLDLLSTNIAQIRAARGIFNPSGEADFNAIAQTQMIDPYNIYYSTIKANWNTGSSGVLNAGPLLPYMYSRTTNVNGFNSTPTAVLDFGVLNFGSQTTCRPYWVRDTYGGVGNLGMDSAWLGASPISGSNGTFLDASVDPTQPVNYGFSWGDGAERCDNVTPVTNRPYIFCVNFLTSAISRFSTTSASPVFNSL